MGLHDLCKNSDHQFLRVGTEHWVDSFIYQGICDTCGQYKIVNIRNPMKVNAPIR